MFARGGPRSPSRGSPSFWEQRFDRVGITTNKQVIPDDPKSLLSSSGIRLGTPAATTRGMDESDMDRLAAWIVQALRTSEAERIESEVAAHCARFPVPGL